MRVRGPEGEGELDTIVFEGVAFDNPHIQRSFQHMLSFTLNTRGLNLRVALTPNE